MTLDTQSRNQTKLWPFEKYWLESFIMSMPSQFLINSFSSVLLITSQVFCGWSQVFLAAKQQETALNEAKTEVSHWCGLNYSLLTKVSKYNGSCLLISCLNTGFRIADKDCHGNYVLISKEQHWRSAAEKLEEQGTTKLQGCQKKTRDKEKLKLIWINQVYGWKEWHLGSKKMFFF